MIIFNVLVKNNNKEEDEEEKEEEEEEKKKYGAYASLCWFVRLSLLPEFKKGEYVKYFLFLLLLLLFIVWFYWSSFCDVKVNTKIVLHIDSVT